MSLDYFRALSQKLDGERVAFLAQSDDLRDKISAAAAAVAQIESDDGDATKARAELRRLKQDRANLKAPSFVDPYADVQAYARTHESVAAEPVSIKIPNGQTPLALHNNLAEKTNAILGEISRVISAPPAPEDLRADLKAQIAATATPPRIVNGKLVFPKHVVDSNGMAITVTNVEGLLAWLHGDALLKLAADGEPGMSAAERSAALTELYEKFTTALRFEAAAAMEAEKAGQRVIRRAHTHPAILLGVKIDPATVYDWHAKKRGKR